MKRNHLNHLLAVPAFLLVSAVVQADPIPWSVTLTPGEEPHQPAGITTSEQGSASGIIDQTSGELTWDLQWSGLTGPAWGAHFHEGLPGEDGPVTVSIFDLPVGEGETEGQDNGSAMLTPDQLDELLAGNWYINVHTELNQPGEIRGQVLPPTAETREVSVPEPGTLALLTLGLLALGARKWRLKFTPS